MQTKRKSIRLKDYDYSEPGDYFVTICTQDKKCLFGKIIDCEMRSNDVGKMVEKVWQEIPQSYPNIEIDEFTIMPNHLHGIITIVGADPRVRPGQTQGFAPTRLSLPAVIHRFKSLTTKYYIDNVKTKSWPPFEKRLWQRNYYEHIIRDENDLNKIRDYIISNPGVWTEDKENPNYKRS